jgi:serine/threonine protein kinase
MTARLIVPLGEAPRTPGEQEIVALLVRELPSEAYTVIPNVLILDRVQRLEYDAIVVAPHAVYALEIKDWSGPIIGDEREWLVRGQWGPSPIGGIEHKAKVLKSILATAKPALGRVRVESVVVLAFPPTKLDLSDGARRAVRLRSEIVRFLSDPAAIGRPADGIRTLDSVIVGEIVGRRSADRGPVRFGPYEVRETLEQSDDEAWYRAYRPEMPVLPDIVLRVVPDSPYLHSSEEREAARRNLYREMEAFLSAGAHPNVVPVRDVREVEGALVVVLDAAGGISLRRRFATDPSLTVEQCELIVLGIAQGLKHLHASNVIHRAVAPGNVLLNEHGVPRLTRFAFAKIEAPGLATVWPTGDGLPDPYRAPELISSPHDVTEAVDIFSLGVLAYELFAGQLPFSGAPTSTIPAMSTSAPESIAALLPKMLALDPSRRPSAEEVVRDLSPPTAAEGTPPNGSKAEYEPGDIIDDSFEVLTFLARGGFSSVYRVYRALDDRDYALKVFNSAGSFDTLQRELTILREVHHPHVVEVVWGGRTNAGQWYLVSNFVDGEPLDAYAYGPKSLSPREIVDVLDQLLDALEAIHPNEERIQELEAIGREAELSEEQYQELQEAKHGIVHRDVKPGNLLLTSHGIILIDFNIASMAGSRVDTVAGTPRYRPPEADYTIWNVYTDLFATGVVAYELLCHKHPFEHLAPGDDRVPADPRTYRPDLSPAMAAWLIRACSGSRAEHFPTARQMRAALGAVGEPTTIQAKTPLGEVSPDAPANTNPYVAIFLEMGSQARRSNTGTRGLTDIARATYVKTRLDEELAGALTTGKHHLAIVTGNAGDGKTAFIQKLEETLIATGAERFASHANGSELRHAGRTLVTLYDGSQDEADESSDAVLARFFDRVLRQQQERPTVGVVAVNEGRLRDFVVSHRAGFPNLVPILAELDEPGAPRDQSIALVNLNLRSVTAGGPDSIMSRQLREVVRGPFWAACGACDWRNTCPIKHNVDTFADQTSGDMAIERLRRLVDIVRLRRRRHLTLRDLRSLISFVLFRDRSCAEIGQVAGSPSREPYELLDLAYFQALGGLGAPVESATERGAALLQEIDVARVANPGLDRLIQLDQGPRRASFESRDSDLGARLIAEARAKAPEGYGSDNNAHRRVHEAARRHLYFERGDDGWPEMLPYRRLQQFQDAVTDPTTRRQLKEDLISAISYSEGAVPAGEASGGLRLASGTGGPDIRAFREFRADEFELQVPKLLAEYIESEPDALQLVHLPSGTSLPVDLDLLEVLEHLRHGHVASAEERRGFLLSLALFKNRLLMEPARELVLEYEGESFVVAPDGASGVRLEGAGQ